MAQLVFENLSFTYPQSKSKALDNINISIEKGEFVVLCGQSGCGKTTLLRQVKTVCAPAGKSEGRVFFDGKDIKALTPSQSAEKIGYVMQDPDSQIVTDKVWHELAFGLENIGTDSDTIRLRISEISLYFGLKNLLESRTDTLSGGTKQLLNLASIMIMKPDIILFDEPTSQLDPVAASEFLSTVSKINREFGTTVILTEHRLEDALPLADRVIVMENGRITHDCTPSQLGDSIDSNPFIALSIPAPMRVFHALEPDKPLPVTVGEGTKRLVCVFDGKTPEYLSLPDEEKSINNTNAVEIKSLYYRYDRKGADIISDLNLKIPKGSFYAVLGGNGEGKTTLLRLICRSLKAYSGKIKTGAERISMVPQDVRTLFVNSTVSQEIPASENRDEIIELVRLGNLLERHPYDLSGGEMQRLALAMILCAQPDIILLDEPTKGMDAQFKEEFAHIISDLTAKGKTVIAVSHDVEFCASYADRCAMLSGGKIVSQGAAREFFSGNLFFTTGAARMSGCVFKNTVTAAEVIELCRKNHGLSR